MPVGPYWMQTFTVASTGDSKTDEYFVSGFNNVIAILGSAIVDETPGTSTNNFQRNKVGSANAAAASPGGVGFETLTGAAATIQVTIIGD